MKPGFQISPNPACSYCVITFPRAARGSVIKVFDPTGAQVQEIENIRGSAECRVSLVATHPGIYFVQKDDDPDMIKLVVVR